jgi:UDP-N-acetylglucosamine 3-dehydrogenase
MRIGVIGCGIVSGGHVRALAGSRYWELAALADIDPARVESHSRILKPEAGYQDYRELLNHRGLDAVIVATHMDSHYEITMAALARGLHVLCEKPMADSVDHCRRMVEAARENRKLLAVNFNTRCGPNYRTIKGMIDAGDLGTLRVVRFVFDWSAHQWKPPARLESFMANGGPILDSGVHFFDGLRWFTGQEIDRVDASGAFIAPYENPQHVIATVKMSGGVIGLVEAGWLYTKRTKDESSLFTITAIGDEGAAHYDHQSHIIQVYTRQATQNLEAKDDNKHFEVAHDFFARSIQEGKLDGLASGEDGLKATQAALTALSSTKRA